MTKPDRESMYRTLAFAAAVAALGASVGVSVESARAAGSQEKWNAVQAKHRPNGASQSKFDSQQQKVRRARHGEAGGPGNSRMLNPQPLPPKGKAGGGQAKLPAVQNK